MCSSAAQYQTDANVAPGSPLIHSPVGDVLLSSQFVKRPDANIFGSGAFLYTYDLGTQNRDAIEVTGIGFMNHYFRTQRLDLGFAEVTAGPRFNFPTPDDRGQPPLGQALCDPYRSRAGRGSVF